MYVCIYVMIRKRVLHKRNDDFDLLELQLLELELPELEPLLLVEDGCCC